MWNPNQAQEDDDSWEVRAFEEDAQNVTGSTWPQRSYTCTFCKREFRSAQALGGHMNVHRRDRARLNQTAPTAPNSVSNPSSTFMIPAQEFSSNGGLCLSYPLPNPNSVFASTTLNRLPNSDNLPSNFLSILQYPNSYHQQLHHNLRVASPVFNSSHCYSNCKAELPRNSSDNSSKEFTSGEEVDLELRLGQRSTSSSSSS